jgi:hypothetical protein
MTTGRSRLPSILGGALLIGLGILILLGQIFRGVDFWGTFWPFFLIGIGLIFFVSMLATGKSAAGLAIPGSILTCLGLMMFIQNLTDHWESWAYSWSVIIFSVGLGVYIKGVYAEQESSRRSGWRLMRLGVILFIIFGLFFEMIFSFQFAARYLFPSALILIGLYLLAVRSGLLSARRGEISSRVETSTRAEMPTPTAAPNLAETPFPSETTSQDEAPPEIPPPT